MCTLQQDAHGKGMGMPMVFGSEWWGCWDVGSAGMGMFMVGWGCWWCWDGDVGAGTWIFTAV